MSVTPKHIHSQAALSLLSALKPQCSEAVCDQTQLLLFLFTPSHALEKPTPQGNPAPCSIAGVVRKREEEGKTCSRTVINHPKHTKVSPSFQLHLGPHTAGARGQFSNPFPLHLHRHFSLAGKDRDHGLVQHLTGDPGY